MSDEQDPDASPEKSEEKSTDKAVDVSPVESEEVLSARADLSDNYKSDMAQRKADYNSGVERDTSSKGYLNPMKILDGETTIAGRPSGEVKRARLEDEAASESSVGPGDLGPLGRKPTLFDPPRTDNPEGATVTTGTDQWGNKTETVTKDGETVRNNYDSTGALSSKVFDLKDGRTVRVDYMDGEPSLPTIKEPDGSVTYLSVNPNNGQITGERLDPHGKVVEKVNYMAGKLVYEDVKTHAKRAESFEPPAGDHVTYQTSKLGTYDPDTGTLTQESGDAKVVSSIAPGRVEIQHAGGSVGVATNGELSIQNNETGEAVVIRSDGSGVHLHGDGTIDRWSIVDGEFVHVKAEKLTETEQDYLNKHPDIDRRDFAEIHERFHGNPEKIDNFYKALEKIDTAKNLTEAEKIALRQEIMDHVANPAEIYQGRTDSCNVTVIQRDLAMTDPARYASTVTEAVSEGTFTANDGTKTNLDVKNLKMADSSGRDLASRIFQGAALQAEFSPGLKYENTPDGVGRLKATKDSPAGTPKEVPFNGMYPIEMVDIRHKLTGEEKAVTIVKSEADLQQALDLNGGPPMTIMVDATHPPFGEGDRSRNAPNHVVTIVGMDKGPPVKYLVQNQWGLEHDHSTSATAIPADELLANMSRRKGIDPTTGEQVLVTDKGAVVISAGDHTKAYMIIDGERKASEGGTTYLTAQHRNPPRVAAKK